MNIWKRDLRGPAGTRGFTLAEMLTVLSIIILLSVMAIVATSPMIGRNKIRYATRQVHAAVLQARNYAIATNSTASIVFYVRDRFCVVTNSVFEPVDAPVVLPEGIDFGIPSEFIVGTSYSTSEAARIWAKTLGDIPAATTAGYQYGVRNLMVIIFQQDGTVKYVTRADGTYGVPTGGIVVSIGGGSNIGSLRRAINTTDNDFNVNQSGLGSGGGLCLVDNEIMYYTLRSDALGQYYMTNVVRGYMTPARCHKNGASIFAGGMAMVCIFPLTGGVVQAQ